MIKKFATALIAIVMIIAGLAILAHGQDVNIIKYNVIITTNEDTYSVVETLTVDTVTSDSIIIWLQDEAKDISIVINGSTIEPDSIVNNRYTLNISKLEVTTIDITYNLSLDTFEFVKKIQYNSTSISINLDEINLFTGRDLLSGNSLNVALHIPPIGAKEKEITTIYKAPDWYYYLIIVLIVIVILSFLIPSKKQKIKTKTTVTVGSEELLSTKKALLMNLLKEVEKQHRAKQISDDTYHKLKDQYKQEAVDAMKKLEDTKSKVK